MSPLYIFMRLIVGGKYYVSAEMFFPLKQSSTFVVEHCLALTGKFPY